MVYRNTLGAAHSARTKCADGITSVTSRVGGDINNGNALGAAQSARTKCADGVMSASSRVWEDTDGNQHTHSGDSEVSVEQQLHSKGTNQ
jgi:hypothetical protein